MPAATGWWIFGDYFCPSCLINRLNLSGLFLQQLYPFCNLPNRNDDRKVSINWKHATFYFDLQKLIHTSTDPLSSPPFLYQTSHLLLLLPAADANSETLLLHLKDRAGCWRIQADCGVVLHNIWTNVTAWLSSLMLRLHGYSFLS